MANSDFWRELAISFKSVPESYEFTAFRQYYAGQQYFLPTSITEPDWQLPRIPEALAEFRALAVRGATMLPPLRTSDLTVRWLEALWKEATEGPIRTASEVLGGNRVWSSDPGKTVPAGPIEVRGKIDRVFQTSSALCRKFEAEALQAEFEEKKRNDPKNWSPLHAHYEIFKTIREIHTGPKERIPESLVRQTIADQLGIKPEEVTLKQIRHEVATLIPFYGAVELVKDRPPHTPPDNTPGEPAAGDDKPTPPVPPVETIADQLQKLRAESRWTIPELAEAARLSDRQVARHLSGEFKPLPRKIIAYELAFSKRLKRNIVIRTNVMKMS